jgi:hypothetical protein
MRKFVLLSAALGLAVLASMGISAAEKANAEYTIKQVMAKAHKEKLLNKVTEGNANAEEKAQLLELYSAMTKAKPPKGDEASWKEKTDALVAAAKAAVDGDADAAAKLKAASNCAACHKAHKGS